MPTVFNKKKQDVYGGELGCNASTGLDQTVPGVFTGKRL